MVRMIKWPGQFPFATIAEMSDANVNHGPEGDALHERGDGALLRCLSLDLEVGRADNRIHALAGVRPDMDQSVAIPRTGRSLPRALARLEDLADGADFLLGHNLIDFDLPHLRAASPNLRLLQLPAVDTLRLNPLAFPRNPYHYLVKHYQDGSLRRGRRNDPELDARLVLEVFADQQRAFRETDPDLLVAWHWLTSADGGVGFDKFFAHVRQAPTPSDAEALGAIKRLLAGTSCRTQAATATQDAGQACLGAGLRSGVAVGGRQQFRHAALGEAPVSGGGATGSAIARQRLRRPRVPLVSGPPRPPQRADPVVRLP